MPAVVNTPEMRFQVDEARKFAVVEEVLERLAADGADVDRTDGARVNTADGWWLLRASNTQDVLVARAEAKDEAGLERLVAQIDAQLALSGVERGPAGRPLMPRLHPEALVFCVAWATLALTGGLLLGWQAGAVLSVGLMLVIMPTSASILSRTDSFPIERQVRWGILAIAALGLLAYLYRVGSVVLVLIADQVELARLDLAGHAPVLERFLAAVGDPDFARGQLLDRRGQLVPVGMVGDDQRQLDHALAGALAHPHPARRHRGDRIGQAARPAVVEAAGRGEHDPAPELVLVGAGGGAQLAERHAELGVEVAQPLERAVDVDRIVMAAAAQLGDQPLRLAERIGADQDAALGIVVKRAEAAGRPPARSPDGGRPAGRRSPR